MRATRVVVAGLFISLAVSGCSVPSAYPSFVRPQTEADKLGPEFDEVDTSDVALETVRYETTYEGVALYLAEGRGPYQICLAASSETGPFISCGGSDLGVLTPDATFEVRPAPVPEKEGWLVLTDNIRVEAPREKYVTTPGPAATPSP